MSLYHPSYFVCGVTHTAGTRALVEPLLHPLIRPIVTRQVASLILVSLPLPAIVPTHPHVHLHTLQTKVTY
jgi:hypothetical protein